MKISSIPELIGFPPFPYPLILCQVRLGTFQRFSKRLGFNSVWHRQGGYQGFNAQVQAGARDAGFQVEGTPNLPSPAWHELGFHSRGGAGVLLTAACGGLGLITGRAGTSLHKIYMMGDVLD